MHIFVSVQVVQVSCTVTQKHRSQLLAWNFFFIYLISVDPYWYKHWVLKKKKRIQDSTIIMIIRHAIIKRFCQKKNRNRNCIDTMMLRLPSKILLSSVMHKKFIHSIKRMLMQIILMLF
jgi:hypothetical protein